MATWKRWILLFAAVAVSAGVVLCYSEAPAATQAAERQLPPQVTEVLRDNPNLGLYKTITGDNFWNLSREMYGRGVMWPYVYGWNVQASLVPVGSFEPRSGDQPYHVEFQAGDLLVLANDVAAGIPDIVQPYTGELPSAASVAAMRAEIDSLRAALAATEASGLPRWAWLALAIAAGVIVWLSINRGRLKRNNTLLVADRDAANREFKAVTERDTRQQAALRAQYQNQLAEQRQIDFAARRAMMPPLPEGADDAVLAGPPVRFEGITPENRERELTAAATEAYTRLHPGADVNGVTVERRNERRVLVSSRPGETVEVSFGDGEPREVTLVREPGWILDAILRRNGGVVQELKDICVLGFCANRICYTLTWIENCLVEPYEAAQVHTIPDRGTIEAEEKTTERTGNVVIHGEGDAPVIVESGTTGSYRTRRVTAHGRITRGGTDEMVVEAIDDTPRLPRLTPASVADERRTGIPEGKAVATVDQVDHDPGIRELVEEGVLGPAQKRDTSAA